MKFNSMSIQGKGGTRALPPNILGGLAVLVRTEHTATWFIADSSVALECPTPPKRDRCYYLHLFWVETPIQQGNPDRYVISYPPPGPTSNECPHVRNRTRFFLDLFTGAEAPLSHAVAARHRACLCPVDIIPLPGHQPMDMCSEKDVDFLLRVAWAGTVGVAHGAACCSQHSSLRDRPGGPPAIRPAQDMEGSFLTSAKDKEIHR